MGKDLFCHEMVLYNHDMSVFWHFESGKIKVTEVYIKNNQKANLIDCLGAKVFKAIVEDIENTKLKQNGPERA
jgi:hypothetical protein